MIPTTLEMNEVPSHLPEPFNGRLIVKMIVEDVMEYKRKLYGMKDSLIALPDTTEERLRVPFNKGTVISMAHDAFGEAYIRRFGKCENPPKVGDVVWFVPNQSMKIDLEDHYHGINDDDICFVTRVTKGS